MVCSLVLNSSHYIFLRLIKTVHPHCDSGYNQVSIFLFVSFAPGGPYQGLVNMLLCSKDQLQVAVYHTKYCFYNSMFSPASLETLQVKLSAFFFFFFFWVLVLYLYIEKRCYITIHYLNFPVFFGSVIFTSTIR